MELNYFENEENYIQAKSLLLKKSMREEDLFKNKTNTSFKNTVRNTVVRLK